LSASLEEVLMLSKGRYRRRLKSNLTE
jgi:hypothetical protein